LRRIAAGSLETQCDHPPILGDRAQLQQAVINLLMNSIEAMHEVDERSRELFVQSRGEGAVRLVSVTMSFG
jgi:nitrogen-specific signal transduction histidine kinase